MLRELRLYTLSDKYINYLRKFDNRVSSNKEDNRSFIRKYLGTLLYINDLNYFAPLSSPKNSDYITCSDGNKIIRKSIVPIIRITHKEINGSITLLGTIKFNNMVPVIESELHIYNIDDELDIAYKSLVLKEWDFIRTHKDLIIKNGNIIYKQKTKNFTGIRYLDNTVDFLLLEEKAKEFK